jgi:hypothetical protein
MTIPVYDIFQVQDSMLWIGAAKTLEDAKDQVRQIGARASAGRFLLLNQQTGNKIFVELDRVKGDLHLWGNNKETRNE